MAGDDSTRRSLTATGGLAHYGGSASSWTVRREGPVARESATRGGPGDLVSTQPGKELVTFPNPSPERDYVIRHRCPEYTAVCPVMIYTLWRHCADLLARI